jgi:hypothetical protein
MSELNKTSTKILVDEEVIISLLYEMNKVNISGGRGGWNVCKRVRRSKESRQGIAI